MAELGERAEAGPVEPGAHSTEHDDRDADLHLAGQYSSPIAVADAPELVEVEDAEEAHLRARQHQRAETQSRPYGMARVDGGVHEQAGQHRGDDMRGVPDLSQYR